MFKTNLLVLLLFVFTFEASYAETPNDDGVKISSDPCLDVLIAKELTQKEFAQIMETLELSEPLRTDLVDKVKGFTESQNQVAVVFQPSLNGTAKITRSNLQGHLLRSLAFAWESLGSFQRNNSYVLIETRDQLTSFLVDLLNVPLNRTSSEAFQEVENNVEAMIAHIRFSTKESIDASKLFKSLVDEMQFNVRAEGGDRYTRLRDDANRDRDAGQAKARKLLRQLGFSSIEDFRDFIARIRWERRLAIYADILTDVEVSRQNSGFVRYPYNFNIHFQRYAHRIHQDIENPYLVQNDLVALLELLKTRSGWPDKDFYALISTYEEPLVNPVTTSLDMPAPTREQVIIEYQRLGVSQIDLVSLAHEIFGVSDFMPNVDRSDVDLLGL